MNAKPVALPFVYTIKNSGDGFCIHRNDNPLKTPAGRDYRFPTQALAEAVATEWSAQTDKIVPSTMPLTQLAATAIDIVPKDRDPIVAALAAHAESELLCHRVDFPAALAHRQKEIWQPYLDWCALHFDALLRVGVGLMPIPQLPEAVKALRHAVASYDDFHLVALNAAVDAAGSLVLGLALMEGYRDAETLFQAAILDQSHQMERWGEDPLIKDRQAKELQELLVCEKWLGLLKA